MSGRSKERPPVLLYNEAQGYEPNKWRELPGIVHDETQIKGFFGEYKWLSNFGESEVLLDGVAYDSVEKAYQAAKWPKSQRDFFLQCSNLDAIKYNRENPPTKYSPDNWESIKVEVMRFLLEQKFDSELNPQNVDLLVATADKYLEETNWWNDTFWGKDLEGNGSNNLGILLMEIREELEGLY